MFDENTRALVASMPVPEFVESAFVVSPPLAQSTVALVTTAGLMHPFDPWHEGDTSYRVFASDDRELLVGHVSMNFDRSGASADLNVVFPIDRLNEMAAEGFVGRVADRHISFMGGLPDLDHLIEESGPDAASVLVGDGVDVVVLTPTCPVCPRTVGTLAHIFENAGLATVALMSNLEVAEHIRPPRALYCDFPAGRPLGVPNDPQFQRDVLEAGFALLAETEGPVLHTFPVRVAEADHTARDPALLPAAPLAASAVEEVGDLRPSYDRARERAGGVTNVGRVVGPADVSRMIERLVRIAEGESWAKLFSTEHHLLQACLDVRTYYEEAALGFGEHTPPARATETWFYRSTAAGVLMARMVESLRRADAPRCTELVVGLVPMTQPQFRKQLHVELVEASRVRGLPDGFAAQ